MSEWNKLYAGGSIHTRPSKEIVSLVPRLKTEGIVDVLDAGCGTGRHALYLAQQGFSVSGIDVSAQAIAFAQVHMNGHNLNYVTGKIASLPFPQDSMDFVLANHSLEYGSKEEVYTAIQQLDQALRANRPFFMRVASTQHPFSGVKPEQVTGFSHIGFCIQNGLAVHFFDEDELRNLFEGYDIERLEHISHDVDHDKITVPLKEWVLFAYKK